MSLPIARPFVLHPSFLYHWLDRAAHTQHFSYFYKQIKNCLKNLVYTLLYTALYLTLYKTGFSQTPAFYHLTTANGLRDNHVRSLAIDKQGLLWIGTEEGLNIFDGRAVHVYSKDKNPSLPSDQITHLYSDTINRIWIGTNDGAAYMDNRKKIHRILLQDSIATFFTKSIIETNKWGIILITDKGEYYFKEPEKQWVLLANTATQLPPKSIKSVQAFNKDQKLIISDSGVYIYDYANCNIKGKYNFPQITSACKMMGNEIAIGKKDGEIIVINTVTGKQTRQYLLNKILNNKANELALIEIKQAANSDLIVATGLDGLITISKTGSVSLFTHDPTNQTSLISNNAYRIAVGSNGEIVVGSSTSGISIYNTKLSQAGFTAFFTDTNRNYYENYTGRMVEGDNGVIWIGAYDRLIRWNKKDNTSKFYYWSSGNRNLKTRGDVRAMCRDKKRKLWVSIDQKGIACFNTVTGTFTNLLLDTSLSTVFKATEFPDIILDDDGILWVSTNKGVFTINTETKKTDDLSSHPLLRMLLAKNINSIAIDSKKIIWFSTLKSGIYSYDKKNKQMLHFTTKEGLASNVCYMVMEDKKGRYFITTSKGLSILYPNGAIHTYTKQNGLRYDRCESVLIDNENIAWVSNKKCLIRADADNNRLEFFDEKTGLLNDGFRVGSCLKTLNGDLLWGGYKGISFFSPKDLKNVILPLQVSILNVQVQDSIIDVSANKPIKIQYSKNSIIFEFAGIHLGIPGKTYYQYRLSGFEKDWQKAEDINQTRYTALPPGSYTFELKASVDGIRWIAANKTITIIIVPPMWRQWWFLAITIILFLSLLILFAQTRNKKIKQQKEEIETEQAINYFANSLHEQQTVENILWDVARNCIGRLQFEDCVVYLLDSAKNVLVQKAAYGPKSPKSFEVSQPMEIPVGKGIVGHVALTGMPELINDTTKDSRYIIDDKPRLSEISVPLIWGGKVIGVIDCEHHKKNHFTQKHLSILSTIASLCANKIIRARSEEERQKAQAILTNTQQKMADLEMQALRAQMNPHFIFNCLNSINRYIVKSDQATASLYLTRFAKLIRLILDNSGNKTVTLSNEIEALKIYIEMEALRFAKKFSYNINIEQDVNIESIELPPLIIQPYVENAIWHGLLHKDGVGVLTIAIRLADDTMLECIIEDNGIGRSKAKELKSKSVTSRKSLGMQLTENRLGLLNRHAEQNASITIIDMENNDQLPLGTKVILRIPI